MARDSKQMTVKPARKSRGAHRRENCVFIGAWIPTGWLTSIDEAVRREDSDRSKVIRRAIEKKLAEVKA